LLKILTEWVINCYILCHFSIPNHVLYHCRSRSHIALRLRLRPKDAAPAPQHWFQSLQNNTVTGRFLKLPPNSTELEKKWQKCAISVLINNFTSHGFISWYFHRQALILYIGIYLIINFHFLGCGYDPFPLYFLFFFLSLISEVDKSCMQRILCARTVSVSAPAARGNLPTVMDLPAARLGGSSLLQFDIYRHCC
jgi:hypothetical protein